MPVLQPVVFLVVAVHRLHRMAERARRQEDRDHQHEGVEVKAQHGSHAQTPDAGEDTGEDRHPDPGPGAEVGVQQERQGHDGEAENQDELLGVLQHRRVQPREAGNIDGVVGVFLGVLQRHHAVGQVLEVERFFPEPDVHHRGGVVVGDIQTANVRIGVDAEADAVGIFLRLRHPGIEDRPHLHPALGDGDAVQCRVRDRGDLVRHDALRVHHVLGDAIQLLEGGRVVDVTLFHLQDDAHDVDGSEHLAELVVKLDVGVRSGFENRHFRGRWRGRRPGPGNRCHTSTAVRYFG